MMNIWQRLQKAGFDIKKIWNRQASGEFRDIENEASYIKII